MSLAGAAFKLVLKMQMFRMTQARPDTPIHGKCAKSHQGKDGMAKVSFCTVRANQTLTTSHHS